MNFELEFNSIQRLKNINFIKKYLLENNRDIYSASLRKLSDYNIITELCIYLLKLRNFEFLFHIISKKIIHPVLIYFWDNNVFTAKENEDNYDIIIRYSLDNNICGIEKCISIFICSYTTNYDSILYMSQDQLHVLKNYIYGPNSYTIMNLIDKLIVFENSLRYFWIKSCILL